MTLSLLALNRVIAATMDSGKTSMGPSESTLTFFADEMLTRDIRHGQELAIAAQCAQWLATNGHTR